MRRIRIVFVGPRALSDVIRHLFHGLPQFELVGSLRDLKSLARQVGRLLPELIIASVKPVKMGLCAAAAAIKRSSPFSRLILICPPTVLSIDARKYGADACLDEEKLVRRLVPAASALSSSPAFSFSGN